MAFPGYAGFSRQFSVKEMLIACPHNATATHPTDSFREPTSDCRFTRKFQIFALLFVYTFFLPSSFAQSVTQWCVPEGGKASLDATAINALTFSVDGSRLAVASTNGTALYDTYTGEVLTLFPVLMDDVTALALSPDNRIVASVGEDATVRLWDARTGEHRTDLIGHTDPVVALAFSPDNNILASGSFREIRLWNLTLGEASRAAVLQGHRDMVTTLVFSPDGKTLASTSFYGTILLWDVETGQRRHSLPAHTDSILALAFSPDNEILASGGYWSAEAESTIRIWNPYTGQLLATFKEHTVPVFALAFSPDVHGVYGKTLASAGWDTAIRVWDPRNGQLQATFEGDASPIVALAFLWDAHGNYGKTLASVSLDGVIQLESLEPAMIPNQQRNARVAFRGDVNNDGVVNIFDLTFIASRFGQDSPDLNGDGIVDILDLVLVASHIEK